MADPFDLFGADSSPEGRAQALASILRKKQAAGALGMLSGDRVLGRYGEQSMRGADEMALQRAELQRQGLELQADRTAAYNKQVEQTAQRGAQGLELAREKMKDAQEARALKAAMAQAAARRKAEEKATAPPSTAERRQSMREDALAPRPGWEKVEPEASAFRTPAQAVAFDNSVAAFEALKNHRHHAAAAMKKFREAKTLQEKDSALALVNQQMANIASKLRVAEGLNSSDASNHAVDTMLSLSNGSVASLRNLANEGRLDAILDSSIDSANANLMTLAGANNLRPSARKKAGADHGAAPTTTGKPKAPKGLAPEEEALLREAGVIE